MFLESVMLNWFRTTLFFQALSTHMPVVNSLLLLYMYPRCGLHKLKYPCILSLYFSSNGSAALMIKPPSECPIKVNLPS